MKDFKTFNLAVNFYRLSRGLKVCGPLKEQLTRASSSIALNLAEGRGRATKADQSRFFQIAMGSVRECQAILMLADLQSSQAWMVLDSVAAHLYKLIKNCRG